MTPLDILRSARERLAEPERWLHGTVAMAANADGCPVDPTSEHAVRWDLLGAMYAAAGYGHAAFDLLENCRLLIWSIIGTTYIVDWHDAPERVHAEVLAVLDEAIRLAEEAG